MLGEVAVVAAAVVEEDVSADSTSVERALNSYDDERFMMVSCVGGTTSTGSELSVLVLVLLLSGSGDLGTAAGVTMKLGCS